MLRSSYSIVAKERRLQGVFFYALIQEISLHLDALVDVVIINSSMQNRHNPKSKTVIAPNKRLVLTIIVAVAILIATLTVVFLLLPQPKTVAPSNTTGESSASSATPEPIIREQAELYKGVTTTVADRFSVKIPNGWTASISQTPTFTAVLFSNLDELDSLVYQPDAAPVVNEGSTPAWNGLTEHFFILVPAASQHFDPSSHLEISSTAFTFDNGHIGTKYDVVKHTEEAKKWGGLKQDTEWQGRTYIYEAGSEQIEAHLALYPSSSIDIPFYENVVRTIRSTD